MKYTFSEGPPLHLTCEIERGELLRIALTPSSRFEATLSEPLPLLIEWLTSYGAKRPLPFPFSLTGKYRPFQEKVLTALAEIPFGESSSYREIAEKVGQPKGARAVGNACGRNPLPLLIPCHRVIASDGKVGGFSLPLSIKETLLAFESIVVS